MNRALKWGVSKHPFVIALAVAGALTAGIVTTGMAQSTAPTAAAAPGHDHMKDHMDRCAMIAAHMNHFDKKLSTEQVRDIFAGRLAQFGEGTLKVGKITPKEPGVVSVEIDTLSGSLVTTRDISTKTGGPAFSEKSCEERPGAKDGHEGPGPDGHGFMGHDGEMRHDDRGGPMGGGFVGMGIAGGPRDLNLNADQVKKLAEASLIRTGNPRLKVGDVKEKDANTFSVDIVTVDNALVFHREVDRHTGRVHRAI